MKLLAKTLLLAALLVVIEGIAAACECPELANPTPEQVTKKLTAEADRAEVIFSGEVLAVDVLKVTFKVERVWKGKQRDEITMASGVGLTKEGHVRRTSCDFDFKAGEKYLVYARMKEGELRTSQCTGTRRLEKAGTRIDFLDELQRKEKQKGAGGPGAAKLAR